MRILMIFMTALLLAGCVESEIPLSPFAPLASGHQLIGSWQLTGEKGEAVLHIGNHEDGLKLLEVEFDNQGKLKSEGYEATSTTLAGKSYLSIRISEKGRTCYYIWKYRIDGQNSLTLWAPDFDFVKEAVDSSLIAGHVRPGLVPSVSLQADQEGLQRFISEHDEKIFPAKEKAVTLRRLPPP